MYRVFLALLFSVSIHAIDGDPFLGIQFSNNEVQKELSEKVPFLTRGMGSKNSVPEFNFYKVNFQPKSENFEYFSDMTGTSILKARFIASWYVFTNTTQIPNSLSQMIALVNKTKPVLFNPIAFINGKWESLVELPYSSLKDDVYVYVYISYPNEKGVLVPLAGQSFYHEIGAQDIVRTKNLDLNQSILGYWKKNGYF